MYFLEYRKFKRGTARRQINKITKLAELYKLENGILSKIKNDKLLIVPKPSERVELIDKYHATSAHFGIESTANRLKEKFWWPKLIDDVEKFKKKCLVCIRNDNNLTLNHPAFANKITYLNDQVSMDFSWGYELDSEGYCGIMVVEEELSKDVEIYPMKTKSAEEIAARLVDYVCAKGPYKRMRSDNETALMSDILKRLVTRCANFRKTIG
jgi:hypothetical protein